MPNSGRHHHRKHASTPVRDIDGICTTSIDDWKDPSSRNFIVVKFSMIKTLREGERGFQLHGNATNLGNWRGTLKSRECPPNSGHHVVYTSLPKNTDIQYKWMLLGSDNRTVKEKELQRVITLGGDDLTVQDVFGVYTSLLPQIFQPDYHPLDQMLIPVALVTVHQVPCVSSQAVAVIGSTPELGRWRAMNAKAMFEVQPDMWATIVYLPRGAKFRYKFVIIEKARNKRILYGERREHRVHLEEVKDGDGGMAEEVKEMSNQPELLGVWTPASNSNLSVKHVEDQEMGSVASDISLGTRPSLGSNLSDIDEDLADLAELPRPSDTTTAQQSSILEEIKEELYGSIDTSDFHNRADTQPLLAFDETVGLVDITALGGEMAILPVEFEMKEKRCTDWLAAHPTDEEIDFSTPAADMIDLSIDDLKLDEDNSPKTPQLPIEEIEFNTPTADINELNNIDMKLDDGNSQHTPQLPVAETDFNTPLAADMIDLIVDDLKLDNDNSPNAPQLPIEETTEADMTNAQSEVLEENEEQKKEETPSPEPQESAKPSPPAPQEIQPPESFQTCMDTRSKDIRLGLAEEGSCASLCTSTIKLPCYCTDNLDSVEIARKLAVKLPWILDLPAGLVCRVLQSAGILKKDKQTEIAKHLQMPRAELLKGVQDPVYHPKKRKPFSLPANFGGRNFN